jgi:hypothetical protein
MYSVIHVSIGVEGLQKRRQREANDSGSGWLAVWNEMMPTHVGHVLRLL